MPALAVVLDDQPDAWHQDVALPAVHVTEHRHLTITPSENGLKCQAVSWLSVCHSAASSGSSHARLPHADSPVRQCHTASRTHLPIESRLPPAQPRGQRHGSAPGLVVHVLVLLATRLRAVDYTSVE